MIWLLTATVFGLDVRKVSLSFSMNMILVILGRETDIHTAEPLVPETSASKVEMAIEKVKDTNHQVMIKSQQN